MKEYVVIEWLLKGIKIIYAESKASVSINGQLSKWFDIMKAIGHGCVLSSWLFVIFMEKCLRMAFLYKEGVVLETLKVRM